MWESIRGLPGRTGNGGLVPPLGIAGFGLQRGTLGNLMGGITVARACARRERRSIAPAIEGAER